MLYQICPRCHFRLQASKHICSTCGQQLQPKKTETAEVAEDGGVTQTAAPKSFWKSLFGIQEPAKDEPALGET